MGSASTICCAVLLAAIAPAASAQQEGAPPPPFSLPGSARSAEPERQGPEIDVFRSPAQPDIATPAPATPAPAGPPPVIAPTLSPAPDAAPAPAPKRSAPAPRPPADSSPQPPPPDESAPAPARDAQPDAPQSAAASTPGPAPAISPRPAPSSDGPQSTRDAWTPWNWIAALALILLAAGLLWRRRAAARSQTAKQDAVAPDAIDPSPAAEIVPSPPAPHAPSESQEPESPQEALPFVATHRARLSLDIGIEAARLTFAGAAIAYRLFLRNDGEAEAEDIMIHALLTNADAEQQTALQRFFAGQDGSVVHSVVAIAPGETVSLTGELRLPHDTIIPIVVGNRALLVPLLGIDAHYRWDDGQGGRSGCAWIVGQEQEPPVPRLAPLRMDQGPRQYRRPGCRATGVAVHS